MASSDPAGQTAPPWAPRGGHGAAEPSWPGTCRAAPAELLLHRHRLGGDPTQPLGVSGALPTQRGNLCPCLGQGMGPCPTSGALPSGQIPFFIPVHALFISFHSALTQQQPPRQRKAFLLSEGVLDLHKKLKVGAFLCPSPWLS